MTLRCSCTFLWALLLGLSLAICRAAPPPAPFVLPNGLRVVMRERHTSPLVAIDLWVRAGAREEGPEENGCAHFLEHTLFKGTTTRGPGEVDIAIENLGATLNAATGPDYAHFYTTVASVHLRAALAVLADVAHNATLPDTEIERERGVILDELAQHDADPSAHLFDLLYANALPTHPYRYSPRGRPDSIRTLKRDILAAFYRRTYTPDRCTLALAGDLTPERAHEEALRTFGDWKGSRGEGEKENKEARKPGMKEEGGDPSGRRSNLVSPRLASMQEESSTTQSWVGIAFSAPAAGETSMACAGQVVAALLGDSAHWGRLAVDAFAHSDASARYTPRQESSLFALMAALPMEEPATHLEGRAARLSALETSLVSVVRALQTTPPSVEEVAAAKRRVLGRLQFDLETNAGLARAIGYADLTGADTPELFRLHVQQLTPADVRRFLSRYLDPAHPVTVRLLPAAHTGRN